MLNQQNGQRQLAVQLLQGGQKIARCDGVQLRGGLIQQQDIGLHHHHCGQAQQLLLPAGQGGNVALKPILDAEKACGFCYAAADDSLRQAHVFQAEGQLVPRLIGDNLLLRALGDKADAACAFALGQCGERLILI